VIEYLSTLSMSVLNNSIAEAVIYSYKLVVNPIKFIP
jgi:hypothetical protein